MAMQTNLMSGDMVGDRYRVTGRIGGGGMGQVYAVVDVNRKRNLAVKVLNWDASESEAITARFMQEALILRKLEHNHVVEYLSSEIPKRGPLYLVMEILSGGSLEELVREARETACPPYTLPSGLTRSLALEILRQCASGLAYAHAQGIAHRDLKPANLLLCEPVSDVLQHGEIKVKLADFGIASTDTIGSLNVTRQGAFIGTLSYAAPEHLKHVLEFRMPGTSERWARTLEQEKKGDMFALGLVMYELWNNSRLLNLAGDLPSVSVNDEHAVLGMLKRSAAKFQETLSGLTRVDPEFELMRGLLKMNPEERPDAREVSERLEVLCGNTVSSDACQTFSDSQSDAPVRRGVLVPERASGALFRMRYAGLALVGLAAVLAVVLLWPERSDPLSSVGAQSERQGVDRASENLEETSSDFSAPAGLRLVAQDDLGRVVERDEETADRKGIVGGARDPGAQAEETAPAGGGQEAALASGAGAKNVERAGGEAPSEVDGARSSAPAPVPDAAASASAAASAAADGTEDPARAEAVKTFAMRTSQRQGEAVDCGTWPGNLSVEAGFLRDHGKLTIPLRLSAKDLVCRVAGDGGVYLDQFVKAGSMVYAPLGGTFRQYYTERPDGKSKAHCIVLKHEGDFWSKLCGLDNQKIYFVKGQSVNRGQAVGRLDKGGRFNYVLYRTVMADSGESKAGQVSLDLRPLFPH